MGGSNYGPIHVGHPVGMDVRWAKFRCLLWYLGLHLRGEMVYKHWILTHVIFALMLIVISNESAHPEDRLILSFTSGKPNENRDWVSHEVVRRKNWQHEGGSLTSMIKLKIF